MEPPCISFQFLESVIISNEFFYKGKNTLFKVTGKNKHKQFMFPIDFLNNGQNLKLSQKLNCSTLNINSNISLCYTLQQNVVHCASLHLK